MPESLLVSSDKPLQVLRDRSVLHLDPAAVRSFGLKNASGEISAANETGKRPPGISPSPPPAPPIRRDQCADLRRSPKQNSSASKAKPPITWPATDSSARRLRYRADAKGKTATLLIGKKEGDEYFARDTSRPTIFRINQDLYKKLAQSYIRPAQQKIASLDPAALTHVEIHNANGTIVCSRKGEGEWSFDEPADQKGKSASLEKLFTASDQARADQIIDHPGADITARFAKPAFEVIFTAKDGKKSRLRITKESGDFVYARNSDSPAVYKLKKQILDTLNFKPSDFAF